MKKISPLLIEEAYFLGAFALLRFLDLDSLDRSKLTALYIVFAVVLAVVYRLCRFRLRECTLTGIHRFTDGFFVLSIVAVVSIALRSLTLFGFAPLCLSDLVWLGFHYAIPMLLTNIILITLLEPNADATLKGDPNGEEPDDNSSEHR